jgi:glutamyl aminopeptidase
MSKEILMKSLAELSQIYGVSGQEQYVSRYLKNEYLKYTDEIIYDNLGSIFAVKRSKKKDAKKVMIAGHMDEVGFIVKTVTKTGCLTMHPIGGWWSQTLLGQRVAVINKKGEVFKGAIGSIPPHSLTEADRAKPMEIKNMLVDIGARSQDEVEKLDVRPGDMIVLEGDFQMLANGNRLLAKAFDNRYGCAMGLALLEAFKDVELDVDLYVGATVQEEVGLRGAQTAASMIDPDLAIVFDCSPANDAAGDETAFGQLGKGLLIRFVDANYLPNRCLLDALIDVCDSESLPYQYYISMGGTDAGAIHKNTDGVVTLTMCICARNIHTNSSIIDVNDLNVAYHAALKFVSGLNDEQISAMILCNQ